METKQGLIHCRPLSLTNIDIEILNWANKLALKGKLYSYVIDVVLGTNRHARNLAEILLGEEKPFFPTLKTVNNFESLTKHQLPDTTLKDHTIEIIYY